MYRCKPKTSKTVGRITVASRICGIYIWRFSRIHAKPEKTNLKLEVYCVE